MASRVRLDELGTHAYVVFGSSDASLQNVTSPKFLRRGTQIKRLILVMKRGSPSDHQELWKSRQLRDDVLGDPIAEVILTGVIADIDEWQHGDRRTMIGVQSRGWVQGGAL